MVNRVTEPFAPPILYRVPCIIAYEARLPRALPDSLALQAGLAHTCRSTSTSIEGRVTAVSKLRRFIPTPVKRQAKLLLHRGRRYLCPFCGYSARDLRQTGHDRAVLREKEVVGGGLRKSACYRCGSADRERLIYFYLKDELDIFNSSSAKSVLHIAPERRLSQALLAADLGEYVCGDLFTPGYNYPEHVRNMDVMELPFKDGTFDLVLCNHVLEHIPTDDVAMREISRVLKPDGTAILQVPISRSLAATFEDFSVTDPQEREVVFGQFDHVRIYGQDYADRLDRSGLKLRRVNVSRKYVQYGVNLDEDLFVCSK